MSDVSIPEPARPRPATVTAAAAIMIFMGAAGLVNAVVGLAAIGGVVDRFRDAAEATGASQSDIDGLAGVAWGTVIAGAVLSVLFAALLIVLGVGNLQGRNGARIATWIVSGLGLLCGCCGLLAVISQSALSWNISTDDQTQDLTQALTDAYPGWWIGLNGVVSAGQALGYLVVALLLALPASHPFFRRGTEPATVTPPTTPPVPTAPPPLPEVRNSDWQPPGRP
ncbi:hypothetical protein RB614_38115 [Phytohabitans sp. ZYX-F-186]|uniref:DUF4064 domain-containing protein n=1 Tax=Phytohabitans maris TaxID=3071409 RepID=A0ABU0ZU51_9ACTN|nr:hypothetical protein [Phytohabitans sp. ZYX-F-186]MDQ7910326.1 hypothetical protein [Phytohabitans sp. ZYX-F-186]